MGGETEIEKAIESNRKGAEKTERVIESADRVISSMAEGIEKMVRENPQILERMSPEEKDRFNTTLNKIKKRMAHDHSLEH